MLAHHALPSRDLYTFTVPNHVWTDHEYLSEVLMALLWALGGSVAISLAFGIVTWLGFYWIWQAFDGFRQPFAIGGVVIALTALAGGPIWGPRAQMISFALVCLQLLWIRRYLAGRSRAILWLPLLMILWANLHSGWAVAFVILGVVLVAEAAMWVWTRQPAHAQHFRRLGLVTLLSAVAVAATPHGLALYTYPFATQFSTAQQSLIAEWMSPDFHLRSLQPLLAFVLVVIIAFAWRRPSLTDMLLTVVLLGLALHAVRQTTIFLAVAAPPLALSLFSVWREEVRPRVAGLVSARDRPQPIALSALTGVVLLIVLAATAVKITDGLRNESKAIAGDFPVAASDWIAAHPDLVGTRMYNQYGWGGYLIYRFHSDSNPSRKVFIFGEALLMGDPLLYTYQDVQTLRPSWEKVLDEYGVDYIVYNRGEALDNVLRTQHGWRLVYEDKIAVIYVRVGSVTNTAEPGSLNAGAPSSAGGASESAAVHST
ncbi:MAG TPA: hypothetical protein VF137_06005 [Candidatus Dormibacteraeota bacterium]